ncbi:hypothetical protein D3C84_1094000 [compost metagenome]
MSVNPVFVPAVLQIKLLKTVQINFQLIFRIRQSKLIEAHVHEYMEEKPVAIMRPVTVNLVQPVVEPLLDFGAKRLPQTMRSNR